MKSQKPPDAESALPSDPSPMPGPHVDPHEGYFYHSTRALLDSWAPRMESEAKDMLEDTMRQAMSLASLLEERYAGTDNPTISNPVELLVDLLNMAFTTIEWWEPKEEDQP